MANEYYPSLGVFGLDIISITDNYDSSIVEHKIPFSNINYLENLGQKRRYEVSCVFYDNAPAAPSEKITPNYDNHKNFLGLIEKAFTILTFVHPVYGEIYGMVSRITVKHRDIQRYVEITFDFIEHDESGMRSWGNDRDKKQIPLLNSQSEKETAISNQISEDIGTDSSEIFDTNIDFDLPMIDQLKIYSNKVREYVKLLDKYVSVVSRVSNEIANPAVSLANSINYTTNVPGLLLRATDRAVERYVRYYDSVRNSPVRFINSFISGIKQLIDMQSLTVGQKALRISGSSRAAYELSNIYKEDSAKSAVIESKEVVDQFGQDGKYVGSRTATTDIMSLNELESTLYSVRGFLLEAIEDDRSLRSFKERANSLQNYVNNVKVNRLRIKEIDVNDTPLHLVCSSNGLSYQMAERLLKLNPDIKNPTFSRGVLKVYVTE